MTFSSKALFAALLLSLPPAVVQAQGLAIPFTYDGAPQPGGNPLAGIDHGGWPGRPNITPVQANDCGAAHFQYLVGRHPSVFPLPPHAAVVYPDTIRATIYVETRLNVGIGADGFVERVFCG